MEQELQIHIQWILGEEFPNSTLQAWSGSGSPASTWASCFPKTPVRTESHKPQPAAPNPAEQGRRRRSRRNRRKKRRRRSRRRSRRKRRRRKMRMMRRMRRKVRTMRRRLRRRKVRRKMRRKMRKRTRMRKLRMRIK